jgi:hypothetical protein
MNSSVATAAVASNMCRCLDGHNASQQVGTLMLRMPLLLFWWCALLHRLLLLLLLPSLSWRQHQQ